MPNNESYKFNLKAKYKLNNSTLLNKKIIKKIDILFKEIF